VVQGECSGKAPMRQQHGKAIDAMRARRRGGHASQKCAAGRAGFGQGVRHLATMAALSHTLCSLAISPCSVLQWHGMAFQTATGIPRLTHSWIRAITGAAIHRQFFTARICAKEGHAQCFEFRHDLTTRNPSPTYLTVGLSIYTTTRCDGVEGVGQQA
jgi:hypothetical protein